MGRHRSSFGGNGSLDFTPPPKFLPGGAEKLTGARMACPRETSGCPPFTPSFILWPRGIQSISNWLNGSSVFRSSVLDNARSTIWSMRRSTPFLNRSAGPQSREAVITLCWRPCSIPWPCVGDQGSVRVRSPTNQAFSGQIIRQGKKRALLLIMAADRRSLDSVRRPAKLDLRSEARVFPNLWSANIPSAENDCLDRIVLNVKTSCHEWM